MILPADVSWSSGAVGAPRIKPTSVPAVSDAAIEDAARTLSTVGSRSALLVGAAVLNRRGVGALERICDVTGAKALHETFPTRMTRGAGRFEPGRLPYLGEMAMAQLNDVEHLILVGAREPVAFFAYPDKPSRLVPSGCTLHTLAEPGTEALCALETLSDLIAADADLTKVPQAGELERPTGSIDVVTAAQAVAATLPEQAIVSDEAATCGMFMLGATRNAPEHDWISLTGGAIGQGMPVATAAAVACKDRPVLNLQADGSAMYTIQSLWTQAHEQLNVTTLLCNNRAYAILAMELDRVGADAGGPAARAMFDLSQPDLDFCRLAEGQGVPAARVTTAEDLCNELDRAYREPGPHLIEAMFPT